jgi:hypothetical protein
MSLLSPTSDTNDAERRQRLRKLDGLLDRLEWVNERGLDELPDTLVAALRAEGIACTATSAPSQLIQEVWDRQEPYLHAMPPIRRRREALDLRHEVFLHKLHRSRPHA